MAGSDVFVLTSRHEGFGVPVLEAMRLGVPVVANAAGALPEVVGDGGLLVDAGDPYAVAEAVARLRDDAGCGKAWPWRRGAACTPSISPRRGTVPRSDSSLRPGSWRPVQEAELPAEVSRRRQPVAPA